MLDINLICGNCKEGTDSIVVSHWVNKMICKKCARLGLLWFLRCKQDKPQDKPIEKSVEPDCDHDFYDVGFVFCTTPEELVPQRCVTCGWHRIIQREPNGL